MGGVGRKIGSFIFTLVATAVAQYICIIQGWSAGRQLWGVEFVLWAISFTLLLLVYLGLPGKVNWRRKIPGTIAIYVLSYALCWLFVPIMGFEAAFAYIVVNYTVWVIFFSILFTWLGL
ncbi:MAG: hypothetical protein QW612_05900 [Candidatus Bathyarchaeia archaeon]